MGNEYPQTAIPPQSIESEQSLIGGLLLKSSCLDDVIDIITPDDFYNINHARIYEAILGLEANSSAIDPVTVTYALGDQAEQVGGMLYISDLASKTPGTVNIDSYARIIRDKATERGLLEAGRDITQIINSNESTRDKADKCEAAILSATEEHGKAGAVMLSDISASIIDRLENRMNHKGGVIGLPTGFERIDRRLSGLQKGNLVIIAGRPSMGKTTLAMNIAEYTTIKRKGVAAVFSLEMSLDELGDKTTCSIAAVDNENFKTGKLSEDELTRVTAAIAQQQKSKMIIDETGDITALQIKSRARKIKRKHGLDLIVIDYLQMMNIPKAKNETDAAAIGRVTRQLKIAAKELDVPIILLSQLNRSLEARANKRPIMSDLRDSGSIEQDADIIMFVYRDSQYNEDTIDEWLAEIITAKYRNGKIGTDTLDFEGQFSRFSSTMRTTQAKYQKAQPRKKGYGK